MSVIDTICFVIVLALIVYALKICGEHERERAQERERERREQERKRREQEEREPPRFPPNPAPQYQRGPYGDIFHETEHSYGKRGGRIERRLKCQKRNVYRRRTTWRLDSDAPSWLDARASGMTKADYSAAYFEQVVGQWTFFAEEKIITEHGPWRRTANAPRPGPGMIRHTRPARSPARRGRPPAPVLVD